MENLNPTGTDPLGYESPVYRGEPPHSGQIERRLLRMWEQVLERNLIGPYDDFFATGGDSLAATVLAAEIESTFNVQFSPADILNLSTVARQAEWIARSDEPSQSRLPPHCILGTAGGSQSPVFVVHGAWGFSFFRRSFIDELGKNRPVYLFQAPGIDGRTAPLASVGELADLYVRTIRQIEPRGPYCLVAMCAGSFIALEMCNRLEEASVARLIFIDPHPHPESVVQVSPESKAALLKSVTKRFVKRLNIGLNRETSESLQAVLRLKKKIQANRARNADWIEQESDVPESMLQAVRKLRNALRVCRLEPYSGSAVMLIGRDKQSAILEDNSFWRQHLSGIEYQLCDWDHNEIFDSNIRQTARFVRDALEIPFDARLMPNALVGSV
jgi:thioesterase domain-containing protein/acyl carrier protein